MKLLNKSILLLVSILIASPGFAMSRTYGYYVDKESARNAARSLLTQPLPPGRAHIIGDYFPVNGYDRLVICADTDSGHVGGVGFSSGFCNFTQTILFFAFPTSGSNCPEGLVPDSEGACVEPGVAAGPNLGPDQCPNPMVGNPINSTNGNKYAEYSLIKRGEIDFKIYYNSLTGEWSTSADTRIEMPSSRVHHVVFGNGKRYEFRDTAVYWASQMPYLEYIPAESGYEYFDQKVKWQFNNTGKLLSIEDTQDVSKITYSYSSDNVSATVSDHIGKTISLEFNKQGQVDKILYDQNKQIAIQWHAQLPLITQVKYHDNSSMIFHYDDQNYSNALTGYTDEDGKRYATWSYDSQGRASSSEHADGKEKVTINYDHIDDDQDPRITVTNALNKQTTYHYETALRKNRIVQVEGHASDNCAAANKAYTYFPDGTLETKTDWQGRVTRYVRDDLGRPISMTEVEGTSEERVTTTEYHPIFNKPVKVAAPNNITHYEYFETGPNAGRLLRTRIESITP